MDCVKIFMYSQILHIIITICQTHNICKHMFEQVIDLVNFKHICYLFFNTKVFQILYSTYHRPNGLPNFLIMKLSRFWIFFLMFMSKIVSFLNWILQGLYFLSILSCMNPNVMFKSLLFKNWKMIQIFDQVQNKVSI